MKKLTRKWWFWAAVPVVFIIIIGGMADEVQTGNVQATAEHAEKAAPVAVETPKKGTEYVDKFKITLSEYGQIENGMSFREVVDIIGMTGTLMSEAGERNTEAYAEVWQWDGIGETGANAVITFQGDKVLAKAQYGLE